MGPLRIVLQRSAADWLIVVATWLVILCATALVAIGVVYGDAVALTGLHRILADQPPTATSVVVELRTGREELTDVEDAIERQVGRILARTGGALVGVARSESYALPEQASEEVTDLAVFGSYAAIDDHALLRDGRWPRPGGDPMEVVLSGDASEAVGLGLGDRITLRSQRGADRAIEIEVVGLWEPIDRADPYWRSDPLELGGVTESASFRTHGPFVVTREDLLGRTVTGDVAAEYRGLPDFDAITVDDVGGVRADTAALEGRLRDALGEDTFFAVATELDRILADASRSLLVSRSGVVVLTIQFAVLAGYALLLVAGLLVDGRRVETALLRSRGAGVGHVVLLSFLEALVFVVPAVLAAPWIAVAVLNGLNLAGPLADAGVRIAPRVDEVVVLAAVAAGVAAIIGLVLPALGAGRGLAAVRQTISRQGNRTIAQRLGLDLALVVLAGVGLWQLRTYGAPLTQSVRGTVGLDPLLVAAPAIGLLGGSILALRIVPLAAELGERLLAPRRGLVAPLGARQLARRPLRYTRSALLLMLAAALGTFAGAYASTWTRSQADQADYRTATDVRATVSDFLDLPTWAMGSAIRAVDGVESALPVSLDRFDGERSGSGQVLGIDAVAAAARIAFRPDLADEPLTQALARVAGARPTGGIPLEGEPVSFTLAVTADLEPLLVDEGAATFSPSFPGIDPRVLIRDADGVVHQINGGRVTVGGGPQEAVLALEAPIDPAGEPTGVAARPAFPLELLAVRLVVVLPEETFGVGTVTVDGLAVTDADGTTTPIEGASDPGVTGTSSEPLPGAGPVVPTVVDVPVGAPLTPPDAVPALASTGFLQSTGVRVGDVVELGQLGVRRSYEIVGSLRAFPTLDPTAPFVIVDLPTLAAADASFGRALDVSEWWVTSAPERGPAVGGILRGEPYGTDEVVVRDELHRDLVSDPVALGLIGALALGALAAVVFAGIGFIVSATVSARERLGEFALLQAIGLSHRQLSAWITIENAFLLVIGIVAGTALGLVLAWVVLPFVTLTQQATVVVPPVEVVIPWGIYGALYLAALAALGVTVLVVSNLLGRVRMSGVLRAGGE